MFEELVRKNRSFRGFDENRKVTKEELMDLVECARLTPASMNIQPLKYCLAWEEEKVSQILKLTKWAAGLPELELPHPGKAPTAFVVICHDTKVKDALPFFQRDVGIVAQTMLLAAVEKGLGGCMIGNFHAGKLKECLGLPENLIPELVLAIGKPNETVILTEASDGGSVKYYRDHDDIHYVPKRRLEDIII